MTVLINDVKNEYFLGLVILSFDNLYLSNLFLDPLISLMRLIIGYGLLCFKVVE